MTRSARAKAEEAIKSARDAGLTISVLDGCRLSVSPASLITDEIRIMLRDHKKDILDVLTHKSYPKPEKVRSKAILEACRALPCQACGADDGTVVAAHANWSEWGKGMGTKADDRAVAALCRSCHHELDQGHRLTKIERKRLWLKAHTKTIDLLVREKMWPTKIPLPQ